MIYALTKRRRGSETLRGLTRQPHETLCEFFFLKKKPTVQCFPILFPHPISQTFSSAAPPADSEGARQAPSVGWRSEARRAPLMGGSGEVPPRDGAVSCLLVMARRDPSMGRRSEDAESFPPWEGAARKWRAPLH
jgi:hypothetical protein